MSTTGHNSMFADTSRWTIRRGIPIFPAHRERRINADGKEEIVTFDRRKLDEMARDARRREAETGDAAPIIVGHIPLRRKGEPHVYEKDLGPLAGYHRNHRVGLFKGKPTILVDWWLYKDRAHLAREFPRRSVEVWDDTLIDHLCLLKRTPQFDLGLVTDTHQPEVQELRDSPFRCMAYNRGGNRRIYQMEDPDVDDQMKQQLIAIFQQGLELLQGGGAGGGQELPPDDMGGAAAAGGGAPADDMMGGAGGGAGPAQYSRSARQLESRLRKLEKDRQADRREITETRRLYQRSERKNEFLELQRDEGLEFDVDDELDYVDGFDDVKFESHKERMRNLYQKSTAPRNKEHFVREGDVRKQQQSDAARAEKAQKAVKLATAEGISFEAALKKVG